MRYDCTHMRFLFLFLISATVCLAEYIDTDGQKKMGLPKSGAITEKRNGVTYVTGYEKPKPKGERAPDIYGGMPLRAINGKLYDFTPVIECLNEQAYLSQNGPQTGKTILTGKVDKATRNGLFTGPPIDNSPRIGDYEERYQVNRALYQKMQFFHVKGVAERILKDGVVLTSNHGTIFLKNYPRLDTIVDGANVECVAAKIGRYDYGSQKIAEYDGGTFDPQKDSALPKGKLEEFLDGNR